MDSFKLDNLRLKNSFLTLLFICSYTLSISQGSWNDNTSNYIGGLYMENGDFLFATIEGYVRKTSDKTKTWADLIRLPSYNGFYNLTGIYQYNKDTLYIYNDFRISKSVNKGATWTNLTRPAVDYIYGVVFFDDTSGIALGNMYSANPFIHRTSNGGASWTKSTYTTFEYRGIIKTNTTSAIAYGYSIQKTSDKGKTWVTATITSALGNSVQTISQASPTILYAFLTGGTKFYISTTSGNTWSPINTLQDEWVSASAFLNPSRGWIGTAKGNLYTTTNGGSSWTKILTICNEIKCIKINANSILVAARNGNIYVTDNLGQTWKQLEGSQACTNDYYVKVFAQNDSIGYCVGGNGSTGFILKTKNGGKIFKKLTNYTGNYLQNIKFLNERDGIVIGNAGSIYTTSDSAKTWNRITTASITSNLLYLAYPSKDTIYIANATDLWFSYNAGASWAKSTTTLAGGTIQSITFINGQKGFLTSGNSYLLGTNDGGTSWQILEHSLYSSSIYSIALSPYTNKGMFFGSVYGGRTNNCGQSWYSSNADNQVLLSYTHAQYLSNSIVFANHKSYNGIARSEDNGFTWQTESTREWAASSYSSFHFSDSNYGYLITKYQIQSKKDQGPSTVTNVDEGIVKSDVQNISNLKTGIFPNPAKDKITVEPKSDKYFILNSLGQEILSSSSNPIDISLLENGLYFVGNGISPMVKFIKE